MISGPHLEYILALHYRTPVNFTCSSIPFRHSDNVNTVSLHSLLDNSKMCQLLQQIRTALSYMASFSHNIRRTSVESIMGILGIL